MSIGYIITTSTFILAIRQIICHWPFTKEITEIWLN